MLWSTSCARGIASSFASSSPLVILYPLVETTVLFSAEQADANSDPASPTAAKASVAKRYFIIPPRNRRPCSRPLESRHDLPDRGEPAVTVVSERRQVRYDCALGESKVPPGKGRQRGKRLFGQGESPPNFERQPPLFERQFFDSFVGRQHPQARQFDQGFDWRRQRSEAVAQLLSHAVDFGKRAGCSEALVERDLLARTLHVAARDVRADADVEHRRRLVRCERRTAPLGDRLLQNLTIRVEADRGDEAVLLAPEHVAGAAYFEIAHGERHARAEV